MKLFKLEVPIGWWAIVRRTATETVNDNCLGLAAQLAYYFFLALFPALLFVVALASFFPVVNVGDELHRWLAPLVPGDILLILENQLLAISESRDGGLLTLGLIGTLWSSSAALVAVADTLNHAYGVSESRPWWRVRLIALGLTIVLSVFLLVSFTIVVAGPAIVTTVATKVGLATIVAWVWMVLQWPVAVALVTAAVAIVYYYAPDVEQEWVWITPGSLLATLLWLGTSLGFKMYVARFGTYTETYGAIGGVIILLLWFYLTGLAILVGGEMNAEIEHASPQGKDPGERRKGERPLLTRLSHFGSSLRRHAFGQGGRGVRPS